MGSHIKKFVGDKLDFSLAWKFSKRLTRLCNVGGKKVSQKTSKFYRKATFLHISSNSIPSVGVN